MRLMALSSALMLSAASVAFAEDPLKIGVLVTLSGPPAVLGEHARDGVLLAEKALGGKVGGRDAEIIVIDDEGKPDVAAQKARDLVEGQGADFVIGPIFSNIMTAIAAPVTQGGAILVSPNAGPSNFAGKDCNPDIFVVSYQNDQMPQVLAEHMNKQGIANVYLLAPNYQAGQDSLNGFKAVYKGEVAGELFVPLGQLDFSAELAQIAASQPAAVYAFMPGGMGVNLVKQWGQAGLSSIPLMSAFTVDETTLPAEQLEAMAAETAGLPASAEDSSEHDLLLRFMEIIRQHDVDALWARAETILRERHDDVVWRVRRRGVASVAAAAGMAAKPACTSCSRGP